MNHTTESLNDNIILVTGGTGFVGSVLVKKLVANGEKVRVIYRKGSNLSVLEDVKNRIELVEADILDVPSLEIAFQGVTKIYHSAALISYNSNERDLLFKVNVEGTANVVNVALLHQVKRLVYVSSIAAIGGLPDTLIDEETKWEKSDFDTQYGISKKLGEHEIFRGIAEGLNAVIVNPGIILGPGFWEQKNAAKLYSAVEKGFPIYTKGTNGYVDVSDVVEASIQLMNSDINGERFILVSENLPLKHIITTIARLLNMKPPSIAINSFLAKMLPFADWLWCKISDNKRSLTAENLKVSLQNFQYSNQKIKKTIGFEFIPVEETLRNTVSEYLKYKNKSHE